MIEKGVSFMSVNSTFLKRYELVADQFQQVESTSFSRF